MNNEKDLQDKTIEALKKHSLRKLMKNIEVVDESNVNDEYFIKAISLDVILRRKYLKGAHNILNLVKKHKIISGEKIKNISIDKSERLYPDILLFDGDSSCFVLLELKFQEKAEREAVTEILAYIHEIKNQLVLANDSVIKCIIISPHFSTLLDHGISSLVLLTGVDFLFLKPVLESDGVKFEIVVPNAWTPTCVDTQIKKSLRCHSLLIAKTEESDDYFTDMELALDLVKSTATNLGAHGFVFYFESDHVCGLTVVSVSPFKLSREARFNTTSPVLEVLSEEDIGSWKIFENDSDRALSESAVSLLKKHYNVEIALSESWDSYLDDFKTSHFPIMISSFGVIEESNNELYLSEGFTNNYAGLFEKHLRNFKESLSGLLLTKHSLGTNLFKGGCFNAENVFLLGANLSVMTSFYRQCLTDKSNYEKFGSAYFWTYLDYLGAMFEINERCKATNDISRPAPFIFAPAIHSNQEKLIPIIESFDLFSSWFIEAFLANNEHLHPFFMAGLKYGPHFEDTLIGSTTVDEFDEMKSFLNEFYLHAESRQKIDQKAFDQFSESVKSLVGKKGFKQDAKFQNVSCVESKFKKWFQKVFLSFANDNIVEVFHKIEHFSLSEGANWMELKAMILARVKRGDDKSCIIISSHGDVSTGRLDKEEKIIYNSQLNFEESVYLVRLSAGYSVATITTWDELRNIKAG